MQVIEKRHKKHMAAVLSQARAAASKASQKVFCSRELFTVDWANTLIGATWGTGLEQMLSAKLATTLEVSTDECHSSSPEN